MTTKLARPAAEQAHHDHDTVDLAVRGPLQRTGSTFRAFRTTASGLEGTVIGWLHQHSITLLRISMGAVILGFGVLKYFPGMSPAEGLVLVTTKLLTFGLVPDQVLMVLTATMECALGLSLILGRGLRVSIYLLVFWVLGILSPALLVPQRLFSGPDHAPTLEGQYVLKDVILLAAVLVIATAVLNRKKATTTEKETDRHDTP
ncbi:MAG: hypothetical protein ACR2GH_04385 [Pseudonocardia sp.]